MSRDAPYRLMSREERLGWWTGQWRRGLPAVTVLLLIVLMTAPLFTAVPALPHLAMLGVFVWAMFQPGLMPPWLAFGLGVIADLLFGLPLGINATLLPATALFVRLFEAKFGHHVYRFDWVVLAVVALVFGLLGWQFMAFAGQPQPLLPVLVQWLTTVATYPAIVALCGGLQRRFLGIAA
jgi:rod shape-determining protein MreD